jgi:hypothetical protein
VIPLGGMIVSKILSLKLERAIEEDPEVRKKIKEFYEEKDFKSSTTGSTWSHPGNPIGICR